jgi:hypothetical protein
MISKRIKIKNKTYQPLQLIINGETVILEGVGFKNEMIIPEEEITEQIKNLSNKKLVSLIKVRT